MIANNLIVNYRLSAENAALINKRRSESTAAPVMGGQLHDGNEAREGQILPMVITAIWSDTLVNGQVFLDGNDSFWATSVAQGNEPGNWNYFMCD